MLRWLNGESFGTIDKDISKLLILLKLLGYNPKLLSFMIYQELKNPYSLLKKELWAAHWYFYLKEEHDKIIIGTFIMKHYLSKLIEEDEILILNLEKELRKLNQLLMETNELELKEELSLRIYQQQELILQIKKTISEISELFEKRAQYTEQLHHVIQRLETIADERCRSVIDCIDHIYEILDQKRITYVNQVEDPSERALLQQGLHNQQVERKAAKKRAEKTPEILMKSGLEVTATDQAMRKAVSAEVRLVKYIKDTETFSSKDASKEEAKIAITNCVNPFDKQMKTEQVKVRELIKKIDIVDEQIAQKNKDLIEIHAKLNLSKPANEESLKFTAQNMLDKIDDFSFTHRKLLTEDDSLGDLILDTQEEITKVMQNDSLPIAERFSLICSVIKKVSEYQETSSLSPESASLLRGFSKELNEKLSNRPNS